MRAHPDRVPLEEFKEYVRALEEIRDLRAELARVRAERDALWSLIESVAEDSICSCLRERDITCGPCRAKAAIERRGGGGG